MEYKYFFLTNRLWVEHVILLKLMQVHYNNGLAAFLIVICKFETLHQSYQNIQVMIIKRDFHDTGIFSNFNLRRWFDNRFNY
jgi:hypothetical protein